MQFKIFKNKKLSSAKDKLYLAQPTMLFRSLNPDDYLMLAKHTVSDDDVVRPDRIAVNHYGTNDGLDIILKFNGISDPFAISPGDTIWIPMDTIPYYKLESPAMFEDNPIKNQFIDTKRLSKTDQRRLEALKKKYNKETLLPPNVIPVGKKNYEFDGTNVRLGMHAQTDPVVKSILSDISNSGEDVAVKTIEAELIIDTTDNSQVENTPVETNVGSGKVYEEALVKNSGKVIKSSGKSSGSGSGSGNGPGGAGKLDTADSIGGNKPDGSAPKPSDNNPTNNPDSPCAK